MSVINSVLRDLQQQRPALRAVDPNELRDAPLTPESSRHSLRRWLFLLLFLLLTGAVLWWQPWKPGKSADAASPTTARPVTEASPSIGRIERPQARQPEATGVEEPPAAPEPSPVLRGLQIREDENTLVLGFQLTAPAVSYLQQQSGNAYRFVLKQTQSRIETPQLESNLWIQKIAIEASDADLQIHLQTTPEVRVETTMVDGEAGASRWELSLHRSPVRETQASATTATGSTEATGTSSETDTDKSNTAENSPAEVETEAPKQKTLAAPTAAANAKPTREQEEKPSRLEIRSHVSKPEVDLARQQRRQAHELFRAGRDEELIRRFDKDPAQDDLLALAYQRLGWQRESAAAWRRLLQRDPANGRAWVGLALALEGLQQYPGAREAYQRALATRRLSPRLEAFATGRLKQPGRTEPATTDRGDK